MVEDDNHRRISRKKKGPSGPVIEDLSGKKSVSQNANEDNPQQNMASSPENSPQPNPEQSEEQNEIESSNVHNGKDIANQEAAGVVPESVSDSQGSEESPQWNAADAGSMDNVQQETEENPEQTAEESTSESQGSSMQSISDLDQREKEKSELLERAIGAEKGTEAGEGVNEGKLSVSRGRRSKDKSKSRSSRKSSVSARSEQKGKRISMPRLFAKKNRGKGAQAALDTVNATSDSTGQVSRLIFTRQLITTKDKLSPSSEKTRSSKKMTVITTGRVNVALPNPSPALKISLRFFRTYFESRAQRYSKLEENLRKAKMPYSAVQYLSFATFISIVIAGVIAAFSVFLFIVLGPLGILAVVFGGVGIMAFVGVFLSLPSSTANKRKKDIESKIPIAISYIATMASADMPIDVILRELGESPEYGEVAKEAKSISMSSRVFGNDIVTAMREGARNSPSRKFSEFLQGIVTTVTSGGNLKEYFKAKATQYQDELNTIIKSNAESIGILAESYVTVGVAFPLMLIVILGVVAALESASTGMAIVLYLIVLMIIPLITISFSFLISSTIKEVNV